MGIRRSFLVAVERPLHSAFGGLPGAAADAARLDAALESAGFAKEHRVRLVDAHATLAAVESRWKRFRKEVRSGDRVVVAWFGRGCVAKRRGRLDCWDTLPDDRAGTSFSVRDWLDDMRTSSVEETVLFLSVPGLEANELANGIESSANLTALLAARTDQKPSQSADGSPWGEFVADAIAGRSRIARDQTGRVTASSLQKSLDAEFPILVRRNGRHDERQTPYRLGHALGVLREAPAANDVAFLDAVKLRRIALRSEATTAVRDLADYRKSHALPAKAGPASRRFVQRLAAADLRADVEAVAARCRERFGHSRRQLVAAIGQDGTGSLRTPDFEYSVTVELDPADSSRIVWRREYGRFADLGLAREADFGPAFDQLVFEPARALDVLSFTEGLEDAPIDGVRVVDVVEDESCELVLSGIAGTIQVRRNEVVVRGRTSGATGLFDCLISFLTRFGPLGDAPALPPKR